MPNAKTPDADKNHSVELGMIDLKQIAEVLLPKWWLLLLCALLGGAIAYAYTHFFITPRYTTGVTLYVRSTQMQLNTESVNYSELMIAQQITDTYINVLQSDAVLEKVAMQSSRNSDTAQTLRSMMSVSAIENTSIINVHVTSVDPVRAQQIANLIARHAPQPMAEYIEGSSVRILNYAGLPTTPSSPNTRQNVLFGALLGLLLAAAAVWIRSALDVRIKTEDDLNQISDIPVLGAIPNFDESTAKKSRTRRKL